MEKKFCIKILQATEGHQITVSWFGCVMHTQRL